MKTARQVFNRLLDMTLPYRFSDILRYKMKKPEYRAQEVGKLVMNLSKEDREALKDLKDKDINDRVKQWDIEPL